MLTPIPRQEIEDRIKEIEKDKGAPLKVSKKLISPHEITINTKNWFESSNRLWKPKNVSKNYFHLSIDSKDLSRALLIVDFIVKLLEYRGHIFTVVNESTAIKMSDRQIKINLRNVGKYKNGGELYRSRNLMLTETLCLQMYEDSWNRKEWKDSDKIPLEEKLIRAVAYTELYAEYSQKYHLEIKEHWRQQDLLKEKHFEQQRKLEDEQKAVDELIITAENFDKAKKIENYLNERKNYLIKIIFSQMKKRYILNGEGNCAKN